MNWTTRTETPGDAETVRRIVTAAFPTPAEAALVDALRRDPAWLDLGALAETPGGDPAGYALLTRCRVGGTPAAALAPVAVLPEWQRRGAGDAAVRAVLDAATARGENLVIVLGHAEYYPRFGFTRASLFGITAPFPAPDEAFMALPLGGAPVPSGTVEYPPPFAV
ncbi:GNAT family N-acetyltransferase [Spirillospora albida]|uniref:GNAT family N-acetyltransferase n=1 Tax=Spirillospora albida TaxID=58123 RepID=UPI0004C1DD88|nr:N-acetyltransferase [Spirillospora albida]